MPDAITVDDLKRFLDAFNRHDAEAIAKWFTDDVVFVTIREGKSVSGREPVRDYFAKMFTDMADVHFGEDHHWVCGDRGCSEWRLTGTTPGGDRVDVRGCDLFTFRDGRISRKDSFLKQG